MGTRQQLLSLFPTLWDHPHACGDKRSLSSLSTLVKGSSPRVWGQGITDYIRKRIRRIIPTRVGTSCFNKLCPHCIGDHPHACGDKHTEVYQKFGSKGSSPRVWGQAFYSSIINIGVRIIPTRVGTSDCEKSVEFWKRDHPHACGDKYLTESVDTL